MRISALPWIVDNGLRRSWTIDAISGIEAACSLMIVLTSIRSFLLLVALPCLGEALFEKSNQFVIGEEPGLPSVIYFLDRAL
jgi:hypothetical protein